MRTFPLRSSAARLAGAAALGLVTIAVGCGSSETTPTSTSTGSATSASSAATTGAGGGSSSTGSTGGAGGGEALCPTGSHPGPTGCEVTLDAWVAGPKIKHKRDHHVTFVAETAAGPFLYVVGGAGALGTELAIERASIAADGTLSAFADVAMMPEGLLGSGLAQVDRAFVIAGGLGDDSNSKTSAYVGQVADDGSVTFTKGPDLGASRYHVSLAYANGYVYATGGLFQTVTNGTPTQKVVDTIERAAFDGKTLSAWEMVAPLPVPLTHHASLVYQSALYVIGGGTDLAAFPDVRRATVSATGDLGAWSTVGQLSAGRASPSATVFLNQLYVIAGMKTLASGETATVLRGSFDAAGNVGAFSDLAPLPLVRAHSHQTPLYHAHLYSVGGSKMHAVQGDVFIGALK